MTEELHPRPGDLLEYRCPRFGIVWQWRVEGVHLGGLHQESLIELRSIHLSPGYGIHKAHETMWVPEPMTRAMDIVRPAAEEAK